MRVTDWIGGLPVWLVGGTEAEWRVPPEYRVIICWKQEMPVVWSEPALLWIGCVVICPIICYGPLNKV